MIQLTFPENLEVKLLVDYVGRRLGLNILYEENLLKKRITLSSPSSIPRSSLLGLLESVLKSVDLAIVDGDQPGWKKIVPSRNILELTQEMSRDNQRLGSTEDYKPVTHIFVLKYVEPQIADKGIRPFLSKPSGNSLCINETNMLIVSDYAGNLKRVAEFLDIFDVKGSQALIKFITPENRSPEELSKQVLNLLSEKRKVQGENSGLSGLAMIPMTSSNQIAVITSKPVLLEEVSRLLDRLDTPSQVVTRSYRLIYTSPQRIDKIARGLGVTGTKDQYQSTIDTESGLLIVKATPEIHKRILDLQKELDVAPKVKTVTYHFGYIAPHRIEKMVRDLVSNPAIRKIYKSTTDEQSGLLIVTAPNEIHDRISELKAQLDIPEILNQTSNIRFYKLTNATASEVLATITAMDSGEQGLAAVASSIDLSSSEFSGPNAPPAAIGEPLPSPPSYTPSDKLINKVSDRQPTLTTKTRDAVVTADPNTNTIIVIAPPDIQKVYRELISVLDKRRPQVMIEVTMVTLDTSNNFSLGVEISRSGRIGDKADYVTFSSFGLSTPDAATGNLTLVPGLGFNGAMVSADIVDVVIRALSSSGKTKVLSAPKVLVNDNASASLSSVSEAPFTSVNASDTVSTTSFGGYASAGTTVSLTPHISEGDHIQLEYSVTLNSFSGEGSAGIPPPRQTNTIDSKITIPDGHAVIVGGLTRRDEAKTKLGLPFIEQIPILGDIISSRTDNQSQSTLFVFIKPVILRDDQFKDLKYLSGVDQKLAEMKPDYPVSKPMTVN